MLLLDRAEPCNLGRVAYPLPLFIFICRTIFVFVFYVFSIVVERVGPLQGHPRLHLLTRFCPCVLNYLRGFPLVFMVAWIILENVEVSFAPPLPNQATKFSNSHSQQSQTHPHNLSIVLHLSRSHLSRRSTCDTLRKIPYIPSH